jgi:menaquinone reductase, multiheme cytochrome c subunit
LFAFPKWINLLRPGMALAMAGGPLYAVALAYYALWPATTTVGYQPVQPVPYSHALHAGELGIDCRYCHNTIERTAAAGVPPTDTCMNCHELVRNDSEKLIPVLQSHAEGTPVQWQRIHDLPDFVFFDHSAHVTRGIGCVSCHARVDKMEVVSHEELLSMGWCLRCHRHPQQHLRPLEHVTDLDWTPVEDQRQQGKRLMEANAIQPSEDCSTCHR